MEVSNQSHLTSCLQDFTLLYTRERDNCPIVLDAGASISLTPYQDDFVGNIGPCQMKGLNGLTDTTPVLGQGKVAWKIVYAFGLLQTIRATAYYIPKATIRLFSP